MSFGCNKIMNIQGIWMDSDKVGTAYGQLARVRLTGTTWVGG